MKNQKPSFVKLFALAVIITMAIFGACTKAEAEVTKPTQAQVKLYYSQVNQLTQSIVTVSRDLNAFEMDYARMAGSNVNDAVSNNEVVSINDIGEGDENDAPISQIKLDLLNNIRDYLIAMGIVNSQLRSMKVPNDPTIISFHRKLTGYTQEYLMAIIDTYVAYINQDDNDTVVARDKIMQRLNSSVNQWVSEYTAMIQK